MTEPLPQYGKAFELAIALVKRFEGCRLEAYPDPESEDGKPWTIGWGATGTGIGPGIVWTQDEADRRLVKDVKFHLGNVILHVRAPNTDHHIAAMTSLSFNIGAGAFIDSTLLKYFNKTQYNDAADEFLKWIHSGKKVSDVLVRRRQAEREFFLS